MAYRGGIRGVRTPLTALVASSLGLAAHSATTATPPSVLASAIVIALACFLAVSVGRRATGFAATVALLAGIQVLAHVVMWVAGAHSAHGAGSVTLLPSSTMLVGHALAAVAAALLLMRLDHVLAMWEILWWSAARRLHPVAIATSPRGMFVRGRVTRAPHPRFLAHLVVRRGPPMVLASL